MERLELEWRGWFACQIPCCEVEVRDLDGTLGRMEFEERVWKRFVELLEVVGLDCDGTVATFGNDAEEGELFFHEKLAVAVDPILGLRLKGGVEGGARRTDQDEAIGASSG